MVKKIGFLTFSSTLGQSLLDKTVASIKRPQREEIGVFLTSSFTVMEAAKRRSWSGLW